MHFTSRTVRLIQSWATPPAHIVDFGAGTGRLAVPLAKKGYRVTAVDPSSAMLDVLAARTGDRVTCAQRSMASYSGRQDADLALCVFSVLTYITTESELAESFAAVSRILAPSGHMIVSVPSPEVLHSFEHDTARMERRVEVEELGGGLHRYHEETRIRVGEEWRDFEDTFELRLWTPTEVLNAAGAAGLVEQANVSAHFEDWGAEYLILRRADEKS